MPREIKLTKEAADVIEKAEQVTEEVVKSIAEAPVKFVQMYRDPSEHPAPHTAQVHRDEVANYALGGWKTEDQKKSAEDAKAAEAKA